jgi:ABC-type amino acid transport substrate-binding protein
MLSHKCLMASDNRTNNSTPEPAPTIKDATIASVESLKLLFQEVLAIVGFIVSIFLLTSIYYNHGVQSQIDANKKKQTLLEEESATLNEQLSDLQSTSSAQQDERKLPHPTLADRDTQAIGDHINVSWEDNSNNNGKYVRYAVQYTQLVAFPEPGGGNTRSIPCDTFIASDSQNRTSRIPIELNMHLDPGIYAWRVAVVSPGFDTSLTTNAIARGTDCDRDEQESQRSPEGRLSEWSPYGSFTLYRDARNRVTSTNIVRVGINLEQNSPFSKLDSDGQVAGTDITLIKTLIEECLTVERKSAGTNRSTGYIRYDDKQCSSQYHIPPPPCTPSETHLCVQFVPVDRWGDWEPALRRKEIDVFVGGLTAAKYRERGNIAFTPGYLTYETKLFVAPGSAKESTTVKEWLTQRRHIGVIANSSNSELLKYLILANCPEKKVGMPPRECSIDQQPYRSYPAMEEAMNSGAIEGLLVDETFVRGTDWVVLGGLNELNGWKEYFDEFIGKRFGPMEQIAFATIRGDYDGSLQRALSDGLSPTSTVAKRLLPGLRKCLLSKSQDAGGDLCSF